MLTVYTHALALARIYALFTALVFPQTKLGLEKAQGTDFNKILRVKENETVADLGAGGGYVDRSYHTSCYSYVP